MHDNLRPSVVRNTILALACSLHQPFTAAQLVEACTAERISEATVYNALSLFVKAELIRGIQRQFDHIQTEYEIMTDSTKRLQYVCRRCGRVVDFSDKMISQMIENRKYPNFRIKQYSLVVYGECKICRKLKVNSEEI